MAEGRPGREAPHEQWARKRVRSMLRGLDEPGARRRETSQEKAERLGQLMVEGLNRKTSRPDPHELGDAPPAQRTLTLDELVARLPPVKPPAALTREPPLQMDPRLLRFDPVHQLRRLWLWLRGQRG